MDTEILVRILHQTKMALTISLLALALTGCGHPPLYDTWEVTDVRLVEGFGQNAPPVCTDVVMDAIGAGGLLKIAPTSSRQPAGSDWVEVSSNFTGYLLNQTGAEAYRCAYAAVTVERTDNIPERVWDVGTHIQLWMMAPHLCAPEPGIIQKEKTRQGLVYTKRIEVANQTEVVFDRVVVASACGIGPYEGFYGEKLDLIFNRWPNPNVDGPLVEREPVSELDCVFIVGCDIFEGCP